MGIYEFIRLVGLMDHWSVVPWKLAQTYNIQKLTLNSNNIQTLHKLVKV